MDSELVNQTGPVDAFKQPRADGPVNLNGEADDLVRKRIDLLHADDAAKALPPMYFRGFGLLQSGIEEIALRLRAFDQMR